MAYKKKNRANKYEEKLRIDGTFEEAMQALLGVHPKQLNMNTTLSKTFIYPKGKKRTIEELRKDFSIKIPEQSVLGIKVEAEMIEGSTPLTVGITAEKAPKDILNTITPNKSRQLIIVHGMTKGIIDLSHKDDRDEDFFCDTLLFNCASDNFSYKIKFTIYLHSTI